MSLLNQRDYDNIVRIGQCILSQHQEMEWTHKTRSNYAYYRLESVYFALEELENVLNSWKRIAETDFIEDKDLTLKNNSDESTHFKLKRAKKNYYQIFKRSNIVSDCLNSLQKLKSEIRHFLIHPLKHAFPTYIPLEVGL